MSGSSLSDTHEAIMAGVALATPRVINPETKQYVLVPDGMKVQDLDAYFAHPMDVPHKVWVATPEALVASMLRFPAATPMLFGLEEKGFIKAVMDFSDGAQPKWGRHVITMNLEPSREWQTWMGVSGKAMGQVDFARFLEDNLPDIAEPNGADILEMASSLEVKKNVQFASSVRLDNGQHQLTYVEDIQGNATKGALAVIDRFTIGLAPWRGMPLYRVSARLRYRMSEGKVSFWVDLLRPHKVVEAAWLDVCATVTKALSGTFADALVLPGTVA